MDNALTARLTTFHSGVVRIEQRLEYEISAIARLQDKIKRVEEEKIELQKALTLIDKAIEVVSANGIGKMESIVTAGLQQVFNDKTIGLVVEKQETKRGYNYRLLVRHGSTIGNPMASFGGGVQNVVAFLLRVIMVKRFKLAKFLCLDESFNNVYYRYLPRVSDLLHSLANDYGFTILAITHQTRLAQAATRIYEVVPHDGMPRLVEKTYKTIREEELVDERNVDEVISYLEHEAGDGRAANQA